MCARWWSPWTRNWRRWLCASSGRPRARAWWTSCGRCCLTTPCAASVAEAPHRTSFSSPTFLLSSSSFPTFFLCQFVFLSVCLSLIARTNYFSLPFSRIVSWYLTSCVCHPSSFQTKCKMFVRCIYFRPSLATSLKSWPGDTTHDAMLNDISDKEAGSAMTSKQHHSVHSVHPVYKSYWSSREFFFLTWSWK